MLFFGTIDLQADTIENDKALKITRLEEKLVRASTQKKTALLNQLSEEYYSINPEKSLEFAREALRFAQINESEPELYRSWFNIGLAASSCILYDEALHAFNEALKLALKLGESQYESTVLFHRSQVFKLTTNYTDAINDQIASLQIEKQFDRKEHIVLRLKELGDIYFEKGEYNYALEYLKSAYDLYSGLNDKEGMAYVLNRKGIIYYDLGDYEKSLEFYLQALEINKAAGNEHGMSKAYNNIGLIYSDQGNTDKALEFILKSLQIDEKLGLKDGVADSYLNIGILYSELKQEQLAISYFEKAMDIYKMLRDEKGVSYALINIGDNFGRMGQYEKAMNILSEALQITRKHGNPLDLASVYQSLGEIYFLRKSYKKAISYTDSSMRIADSLNLSGNKVDIFFFYHKIYAGLKDYQNAYKYLKDYTDLKDSVYTSKFRKLLNEMQIKHGIEYKEIENEQLKNEYVKKEQVIREQRLYMIIIVGLAVLSAIIVWYDFRIKKRKNRELSDKNDQITNQKDALTETLKKLTESEEKYRMLVKHSPTGILLLDTKGNILELNKAIIEILGSPGEEATKKINCLEFPPLKEAGLAKDILECIRSGQVVYNETSYKTKWGKDIYVRYYLTPVKNELNEVIRVILNLEDFTITKEAEKARIESETSYRTLVENSIQAMFVIQDGKLVFANHLVAEMSRYSMEEILSMGSDLFRLILHPDDIIKANEVLAGRLTGRDVPARNQWRYMRKDGSLRWVETMGSIIPYNGKPATLIVAMDITESKEADDILRKSEKELREANATKDKFFSIIAHDLKNPFNAILGFSSLLQESYDSFTDEQRKKFIHNIAEASGNTYKLLQNLLEWSRTRMNLLEHNPEMIDMSVIANENISLLLGQAKNKDINLLSYVPFNTIAFADENMIRTVVRNLLSNAIKFSYPGSDVEIYATSFREFVEVSVVDHGVGIHEDDIGKLFHIDMQLRAPGTSQEQGSGIGLIMCKELVEKNGGTIWAESTIGQGSSFKFTLPVSNVSTVN